MITFIYVDSGTNLGGIDEKSDGRLARESDFDAAGRFKLSFIHRTNKPKKKITGRS